MEETVRYTHTGVSLP